MTVQKTTPPPALPHVYHSGAGPIAKSWNFLYLALWWGGRPIGIDINPNCRLYGIAIGLRFFGCVRAERVKP